MVEIKKNESSSEVEIEWENIDNFISNFARSNENMSADVEVESKTAASTTKSAKNDSFKKPHHVLMKTKSKSAFSYSTVAEVSKKLIIENQDKFSDKYNGLHTDIKNLLIELQEIKKARIDLQTKLESLR